MHVLEVFLVVLLSLVPSLPLLPALLTVLGPGTCPTLPHRLPSSLCVSDTFGALGHRTLPPCGGKS